VPHVLEHSVLCGSRKFPVKEPFVDLLKGSLQNFLNAFTYPDRTCYPVASTNRKDFYNLVHVYLDAVLHPRAISDPQVLLQEGWHYELEEGTGGPLSIKGVVYNEMKGVYSSPDSLMGRATQQALFPENTYGVDSGGDPLRIPDLTFDQFKAFHGSYYHPSNSRVFFYGNDDPMERLVLLDSYLSEFDAIPVTSQIHYQPKVSAPKRIELGFPLSPGADAKHMVTLNWLLNDAALPPKEMLALGVLDYLLLGTSSSSLRKTLTESQLGESVTGGGLSDELLQSTFSVGLKGVEGADCGKVEALIQTSLQQLSESGFEAEAVQAAINTYEFRLREFNTGSFPKGLSVMLGMMSKWIYDQAPADGVRFEEPLQELKADLAAGKPVFQELISKYLASNQHRVTVEMKPDFEMESRRVAEEEAMLATAKEAMTQEQLEDVLAVSTRLREAQEAVDSAEAKATLPKLGLEDIDPSSKELPIEVLPSSAGLEDATILTHDLETSGILYADVAFDYSSIDEADLELLPLFSRMLMEAGTSKYDLTTLSRKIGSSTGGISVAFQSDLKTTAGKVGDPDAVLLFLLIRGKAVQENVPVLFELFSEILQGADFGNQKRAVEMLKESKVRKESAILSAGHSFAATRLAGRSSFLGYLGEVTGGLTSVRGAGALLNTAESDWASVQSRLERMRLAIVQKGREGTIVNLTGDKALVTDSLTSVKTFLGGLQTRSSDAVLPLVQRWSKDQLLPRQNEAFVMPSQVNYVALGGQILNPGDSVKGSYTVASRYLSTGYLWDQVRVLGGAYGGFARFSAATGRFVFMSYRDPNCLNTLNTFDNTATALSEAELSSEELLQAIIGTVGDLDSPMTSDQKGFVSMMQYMSGESAEERQQWRSEVLQTGSQDFQEFAQHLSMLRETGTVAVFGAQGAIDIANEKLPANRRMIVDQALVGKKAE
jgi:Zn-dependent M16 (insulinase) family peptidase